MTMKTRVLIPLLIAAWTAGVALAAGDPRDSYWAGQLERSPSAGDIVQLGQEEQKFLALFRADTTGTRHGGAVLLHPMGAHPDWPEVIAPLRRALPGYGWASLAIQLPVFDQHTGVEAYVPTLDEAAERIRTAAAYLRDRGVENVVLIGYGLGATLGASYLAETPDSGFSGFVAISMTSHESASPRLDGPGSLEQIALPILDIYGGRDLPRILTGAADRAAAARRAGHNASRRNNLAPFRMSASAQEGFSKRLGLIAYRQFKIAGAGHGFVGFEPVLIKRVIGWIKHHAGGITTPATAMRQEYLLPMKKRGPKAPFLSHGLRRG